MVRDDCFDCVTFCETVLAAAMVRVPDQFETMLRKIRYRGGRVAWRERNHYFADWCTNNTANNICRRVALPGSETLTKRVSYMPALGARTVTLEAVPIDSLLANRALLKTGDIIGFLSRQPRHDYFHVGFLGVAGNGGLWLRHAAKSRHRVLDQPLIGFIKHNRVQAVTLLRPRDGQGESPQDAVTIV